MSDEKKRSEDQHFQSTNTLTLGIIEEPKEPKPKVIYETPYRAPKIKIIEYLYELEKLRIKMIDEKNDEDIKRRISNIESDIRALINLLNERNYHY
jgi:hypothetical protein